MATMIPRQPPPPGPGRRAESVLWHALQAQLPDDWFVYWSYEFLDDSAREGEVDFLLLHREKGLLCVECKGDGVRMDGRGRWLRRDGDKDVPLRKSPFRQARVNAHKLVDLLAQRWQQQQQPQQPQQPQQRSGTLPFVHGYAVAFPLGGARREELLPADVQPQLLLDVEDLGRIERWVDELQRFWSQRGKRSPPPLPQRAFKRFRKSVVHPTFEVISGLDAQLRADAIGLQRASEEQLLVMNHLLVQPRLRVVGGAGTGKTMLALEVARRHASAGKDVLFLCFNRALAGAIRGQLDDDDLDARVTVLHFHSLCWRECKRVTGEGLVVPDDPEQAAAFWRDDAPNYVLESIVAGTAPRFDAIVVDEAQDLLPTWWMVVEELLHDRDNGSLAIFGDVEQDIFGHGGLLPGVHAFPLTINFRNTRAIARVVSRLGRNDTRPWRHCPEGIEPQDHQRRSAARDLRGIEALVTQLVHTERIAPDRIVILTPHRRANSALADCASVAGLPLASDPTDRAGAVLHSTLSAFKGLESDVVILADIDVDDERANRRARYVACSRARHLLHVWSRGDWRDPDA